MQAYPDGHIIFSSKKYLPTEIVKMPKSQSECLEMMSRTYQTMFSDIHVLIFLLNSLSLREFCPCIDERSDLAPSFYIGHSQQEKKLLALPVLRYDWRSRRFAASKLPGLMVPMNPNPKYDVGFNRNILSPRCNATLGSYIDEEMLQDSWQLIHNITSLFPGSDVSGGIFLYPRQAILLTYLLQREIASRAKVSKPFRICETGFGSGHSASLFLSAAPNIEVVSFDTYSRPYQTATFTALRSYFGGKRLTRVIGDSCKTVKSYSKQCDFLHGSSCEFTLILNAFLFAFFLEIQQ